MDAFTARVSEIGLGSCYYCCRERGAAHMEPTTTSSRKINFLLYAVGFLLLFHLVPGLVCGNLGTHPQVGSIDIRPGVGL